MISALDFKARVDPLLACFIIDMQQNPQIHLWCNTCWPLGSQYRSQGVPIHILANKNWLVGLESEIYYAAASQHETRQTLYILDWTLFRIYCGPEFLKIQHDFVWLRTEALFQMYLQLIYLKWFCLSVNFTNVTMKLLLDNCLSNVLIRNTLPTGGISEDHQFCLNDKTALSNSFPLWLLYKFGHLQ